MIEIRTAIIWMAISGLLGGQGVELPLKPHQTSRRQAPVLLDGLLVDEDWAKAFITEGFDQSFPMYGEPSNKKTQVRILYDDDYVYIGARMMRGDSEGGINKVMTGLNRRDQRNEGADNFMISFDPILSRRVAYVFGVTAAGVQMDFIFSDGQRDQDYGWDAIWESAVSVDETGWTAELKIPFSTMRLRQEGDDPWGVNMVRTDHGAKREESKWYIAPRTASSGVANYPLLVGIAGVKPKLKREWSPFLLTKRDVSTSDDTRDLKTSTTGGLDARWGLTPNSEMSLAWQPDFGQVEVDETIVNLSALETFLPEKRPFFLEGGDIFQVPGPPHFYSRRIGQSAPQPGLMPNEKFVSSDLFAQITGALKYTAKLDSGFNLGVVGANTKTAEAVILKADGSTRRTTLLPSTSYGVARAAQSIDDRGSFVGIFASWVNRSGTLGRDALVWEADTLWRSEDRSTTYDISFSGSKVGVLGSEKKDWRGRFNVLKRFSNGVYFNINPVYAGRDFDLNDLGYQGRTDERRLSFTGGRAWDKPMGIANNFSVRLSGNYAVDAAQVRIKHGYEFETKFNTSTNHSFEIKNFLILPYRDDYELRTFSHQTKKYLVRDTSAGVGVDFRSPQFGLWSWRVGGAFIEGDEAQRQFGIENTFRISDQLVFNVESNWKHIQGDYWIETIAGGPAVLQPGMDASTPIIGNRLLSQFSQEFKSSYTVNPRLSFQLTSEWVGVNYIYRNPRAYVRDGQYQAAPQTQRSLNGSFRSWIINLITRWEYRPGSTLFVVYGKNTNTSETLSILGGISPLHDLRPLSHLPSDDTIQIKFSYLFR